MSEPSLEQKERSNSGRVIRLGASTLTLKAVSEQTKGAYALIEYLVAPGDGAPRHKHTREDEAFYILDGTMTFQLGDRTETASAGGFVFIPRGLVHAFANTGSQPARTMLTLSPAGLEQFFCELDDLLTAGAADNEAVVALNQRYGLDFSGT